MLGHSDAALGEKLLSGDERRDLIEDDRRGWGELEKRFQQGMQAGGRFIPLGEIESADRQAMVRKLVEKGLLWWTWDRESPQFTT